MWRVIDVSEDGRHLALERRHVAVRHEGQELGRVPLADCQAVIVHGTGCTVSLNLVAALAEEGIPLVLCGSDHLPRSLALPVTGNFESARRTREQADAPLPLRKRLWRDLVRSKIKAQALALERAGHPDHVGLAKLIGRVRAGDPENVEAQAARYYWQRLMGPDFRRDPQGAGLNGPLNYGYTILRSAVARAIVAAGLSPVLGLHHRGRLNAFQLADDLMEPFRPLVDLRVRAHRDAWADGLPRAGKAVLADLVNAPIRTEDGVTALTQALGRTCLSLVAAHARERSSLWLPSDVVEGTQADLPLGRPGEGA